MKVVNRSDGQVVYVLPELNIRRVFNIGEDKDLENDEVEALWQSPGGVELIQNYLLIEDKEWIKNHWREVPLEYFWSIEDIKKCLLEDPIDLFQETLDYAPDGVLDIMKRLSWQLPLNDLNKMDAIQNHKRLMFNVQAAIKNMKPVDDEEKNSGPIRKERLRK